MATPTDRSTPHAQQTQAGAVSVPLDDVSEMYMGIPLPLQLIEECEQDIQALMSSGLSRSEAEEHVRQLLEPLREPCEELERVRAQTMRTRARRAALRTHAQDVEDYLDMLVEAAEILRADIAHRGARRTPRTV